MLCRLARLPQLGSSGAYAARLWPQWQPAPARKYSDEAFGSHELAAAAAHGNARNLRTHGIISTVAPQTTTIDNLLDGLETAAFKTGQPVEEDRPSLLTLLLTPSFARHALDPQLPLRALEKLMGSKSHVTDLRTVTAVVDRLPVSATAEKRVQSVSHSNGLEGLAYAFIGAMDSDQEALLSTRTMQVQNTASSKQFSHSTPGALSFLVQRNDWRPVDSWIQLPLAQTIFSNGRTSTMLSAIYRPDESSDKRMKLLGEPLALDTQSLPLPFPSNRHGLRPSLPLVPLTVARTVQHCMGNIVRSLSSQKTDFGADHASPASAVEGSSQPASTELETAVQEVFARSSVEPHPVQVWALVIPASFTPPTDRGGLGCDFRALLNNKPSGRDDWLPPKRRAFALRRLIVDHGARLCRVLSGGGGWGKKAGLLSLDPEVGYSSADTSHQHSDVQPRDLDQLEAFAEGTQAALGRIVKEGESIMFFLGPPASASSEIWEYYGSALPWDMPYHANLHRAQFGCIPSTIDGDIYLPDAKHRQAHRASNGVQHERHLFGALSEGGLALSTEMSAHYKEVGIRGERWKTRLDVPFACINIAPLPTGPQAYDPVGDASSKTQTLGSGRGHDRRVKDQRTHEPTKKNIKVADSWDSRGWDKIRKISSGSRSYSALAKTTGDTAMHRGADSHDALYRSAARNR